MVSGSVTSTATPSLPLRQDVRAASIVPARAGRASPIPPAEVVPGTCKEHVRDLMENPDSGAAAQAFHYFIMVVIVVSTFCVIVETVPEVSGNPIFLPAEMCFTALFTAEFALRLYACESVAEFATNGFNIIDFLAVFPGYLSLLGVMLRQDTHQKHSFAHIGQATRSMRSLRMVRVVRMVRVFRVMRVCKVARHSEALAVTFMVFLKVSQSGLAVVLMLMGFATAGSREGMCSYEFVEAIMLHVRKILLHAGKVLVSEDTDAPKSMYAVLWGTLDVYRMGQKIGSLSNGQVLGEGLLVGIFDRWTTTVVARNSCMVCEVPQTALSEALLDHPEESEYFKKSSQRATCNTDVGEWAQHGSSEMRLALRRPASLRQVSEDFLAALEAGLVSHLYFAGDVIHTEGQEDPPLAFLFDGDVSVEAAGRAVRREEVPGMEMRFVMEGETTTGRGSTAITDSETLPGSPTAKSRRSSASGRRLSQARRPSVDTGEFNSSLMAVSNRARAEAMMAEATAGGPEPGFTAQSLPEAAVFGEDAFLHWGREAFLGLIPGASVTVRVCKMSEVRLLYRSVFDQTLERFPADREWLQRFQLDAKQAFPFHDFRDSEGKRLPQDHILPDNLNQFVPSSILSPTLNISCAAVNVGHVRLQTLHDQPLLPFGHLSSGDILGPGSILPGSWFWSGAEVQALQLCCLTVLHRGIIARALEDPGYN
eukprot:s31_g15.t1